MPSLLRREGRTTFGKDPSGYARYRLPYPPRVLEILKDRCGLTRGSRVFEIGPGPGLATRELLRLGANPLYVVEPDPRLARYLARTLGTAEGRLRFVRSTFEDAPLPAGRFDLGVAATSFHWVHARRGLPKVARLLRPGGWWAMWWNRHGDPEHPSEFHRATHRLWRPLESHPTWVRRGRLDSRREVAVRLGRLGRSGDFDRIDYEVVRFPVELDPAEVRGLWATFGNVLKMSPARRRTFLDAVERIAREEFGGKVRFDMSTPIYTARRA